MQFPSTSAGGHSGLDGVTRLASEVLGAPIALLTLVESEREVLRSSCGLPTEWASGGRSPLPFCLAEEIMRSGRPLLIEDLLAHPAAAMEDEGLHLASYAGVPLHAEDESVLGVLSAVDRVDRRWTAREVHVLEELSSIAARDVAPPPHPALTADPLHDDHDRFRVLVEHSLAGVYLIQDDRFLYVNPRLAEIFGYKREEIVAGLRPTDLVAPEDRARVATNIRKRLEGEWDRVQYAFRGLRKDGSTIEAEVLGSRTEVGGRPAVIGTLLDATERREAAEAIRESEERYRLVARAAGSAIRDWDLRTGRCVWDGASEVLLRYAPSEIGSEIAWWHERIHRDDRERVITGIHAALDGTADSWSDEYRFQKGDGEYATVLDCCYITRDERGVPQRVVGSISDISERKRVEGVQRFLSRASAVLSEDLGLDTILGSLARLTVPTLADYCLIDLVDRDHLMRMGLAHIDPAKERILRANERHPLDGDPERHPLVYVIRSGESVLVTECTLDLLRRISHDEEHHRKLMEMGIRSFMIVPLLAKQKVLGAITLVSAESERHYTPRDLMVAEELSHRAATAIEHANLYRAAQAAVRTREEVLGVVSHDLRNPLHTVQLSVSLLLDGLQDRRQANLDTLAIIQRAANQMNLMIDDLLDMSKIEAGTFSVERRRATVAELLKEAGELLEPLAAERRLQLHFSAPADMPAVWVDTRQIARVFSNLVGNAIKFTPEAGAITVSARRQEDEVVFEVNDTGPGIPPEKLSHVFDRFWQARDGDHRGAGLGLAIAKGIVEAHGGRIWADSEPDDGATFSFTVPLD